MKTLRQLMENSTPVDYGCAMIYLPDDLSMKIRNWVLEHIKPEMVDPKEGLESEHHVTVKYGILTASHNKVANVVKNYGDVSLKLGKISIFDNPEHDVLKIEVKSKDLKKLNKYICTHLEHVNTTTDYIPHATIGYLKKGQGSQFVGDDSFDGMKFTANRMIYSNANKDKKELSL